MIKPEELEDARPEVCYYVDYLESEVNKLKQAVVTARENPNRLSQYLEMGGNDPDVYQVIAEQTSNEESLKPCFYNRPAEDVCSKPATSFNWELLQAMNHLTTAISCTDDVRAAQLTAALNIIKGVSADD